jgi:hypothetical protein
MCVCCKFIGFGGGFVFLLFVVFCYFDWEVLSSFASFWFHLCIASLRVAGTLELDDCRLTLRPSYVRSFRELILFGALACNNTLSNKTASKFFDIISGSA